MIKKQRLLYVQDDANKKLKQDICYCFNAIATIKDEKIKSDEKNSNSNEIDNEDVEMIIKTGIDDINEEEIEKNYGKTNEWKIVNIKNDHNRVTDVNYRNSHWEGPIIPITTEWVNKVVTEVKEYQSCKIKNVELLSIDIRDKAMNKLLNEFDEVLRAMVNDDNFIESKYVLLNIPIETEVQEESIMDTVD